MDLPALLSAVVGALVSTGIFALLAWMTPAVRWARRIKRDVEILAGLPEGEERKAWQLRISSRARHLRLYEEYVPRWHRTAPMILAVWIASATGLLVFSTQEREAFFGNGPSVIFLGIAGVLGAGVYIVTGILGLDFGGNTPEKLAFEHERRSREIYPE